MTGPNVVVFGYDELVHDTIAAVREGGGDVAAVVFPSVRSADPRVQQVRAAVADGGLSVLEQPADGTVAGFATALASLRPDLFLVWSYPMILPADLLEVPRFGCLNLHMGLLPEYRGAQAVQWAIINGESETGVTLHYMDAGVDSGPMLAQVRIPIDPDDDVVSVLRAARAAGVRLLREGWPHFSVRRLPARAQDGSRARYHALRTADDDRVDWSAGASAICNLVRATTRPFPGAHSTWEGRAVTVRDCRPADTTTDAAAGTIVAVEPAGILVACGGPDLRITEIECDGQSLSPDGFVTAGGKAGQSFV